MIPPTLPPGVVVSKMGKGVASLAQAQPLDLLRDCPRRASET